MACGVRAVIAALFVDRNGIYRGMWGVDAWDERRDARLYAGPHSVVAHPPCRLWINLGALNYSRWGGEHNKPGNDGGCFASALASVRKWGGVLEHPAYTRAFAHHGIPDPTPGWWQRSICGGWVCHVEQCRYGHQARKATWLYAVSERPLPSLDWTITDDREDLAAVSWLRNRGSEGKRRISRRLASATPAAFRDILVGIARGSRK